MINTKFLKEQPRVVGREDQWGGEDQHMGAYLNRGKLTCTEDENFSES